MKRGWEQGKEMTKLQMVKNLLKSEAFINGAISYQTIAQASDFL